MKWNVKEQKSEPGVKIFNADNDSLIGTINPHKAFFVSTTKSKELSKSVFRFGRQCGKSTTIREYVW